MTFDEFSKGLISLASDHGKDLTPGQITAYYKVLGHYDARDWAYAVICLTAASHFPKNHREMQEELERRQTDRKRLEADRERVQANNFFKGKLPVPDGKIDAMVHQCCMHIMRHRGTAKPVAVRFIKASLEDREFADFCKNNTTNFGGGEAMTYWTYFHKEMDAAPGAGLCERMPDDSGMD